MLWGSRRKAEIKRRLIYLLRYLFEWLLPVIIIWLQTCASTRTEIDHEVPKWAAHRESVMTSGFAAVMLRRESQLVYLPGHLVCCDLPFNKGHRFFILKHENSHFYLYCFHSAWGWTSPHLATVAPPPLTSDVTAAVSLFQTHFDWTIFKWF